MKARKSKQSNKTKELKIKDNTLDKTSGVSAYNYQLHLDLNMTFMQKKKKSIFTGLAVIFVFIQFV